MQNNNIKDIGYYVGNLFEEINDIDSSILLNNIQIVKDISLDKSNMLYRFDYYGGSPYADNKITFDKIKDRDNFIQENNYNVFQRW